MGVLFYTLGLPIVIRFFFEALCVGFHAQSLKIIIEPFIFKGHTTFQRLIAREPPGCLSWSLVCSSFKTKNQVLLFPG